MNKVAPGRPNPLRQALRGAMALALPRRMFLVRGPHASRSICLTFDDGPHPEHTPRLLDVLKELKVSATFFVVGQRAQQHPQIVRRAVSEGHLVANHSFSHSEPTETSAARLAEEVLETDALLDGMTGRGVDTPRLFRPPKGELSAGKLAALWRAGRCVVLWDVDPKDYACDSAEALRQAIRNLQGGSIVLLHDSHPHAAGVLPDVVRDARARGLDFVTPDKWIRRERPLTGAAAVAW